ATFVEALRQLGGRRRRGTLAQRPDQRALHHVLATVLAGARDVVLEHQVDDGHEDSIRRRRAAGEPELECVRLDIEAFGEALAPAEDVARAGEESDLQFALHGTWLTQAACRGGTY